MNITITLHCPNCQSTKIKKNGKKACGKQNYLCKNCFRQFIGDHALTYKGSHSGLIHRILLMLVRGIGIRDISVIQEVSIRKVLSVLVNSHYVLTPRKSYYPCLEVDEFWTYVGNKGKKYWLLYAYERQSGEVVAYVWGKRDLKTAKRLKEKLLKLDISFGCVCTDDWQSFITAFKEDNHVIGKSHTVGIEGNNCRLRHRIRRAFRKTCCFSKKLFNHLKAFRLAFFYINYGYV
ncbi:hypothetical protein EZS27_002605 [termite gut metagenome]|uniref:InsA N-terminal zinc ribbon domain-containing protein n=1 Tax=termite gut metagenome TaxID=433724 RepID=A0A5J4SVM7_9ZZZZ